MTGGRVDALEKPLPKPRRDLTGYASARLLEALAEALVALGFLEKGYTRNAAGKAFQAWRALTGAILALEYDRIVERLEGVDERRWFTERGLLRIPTTRLKAFGQLIEGLGYRDYSPYTDKALDLHDYQYHGPDPDPDVEASKYRRREEAALDTLYIIDRIVELVEGLRGRLVERGAWSPEHDEALSMLRESVRRVREAGSWRVRLKPR